ncbi:MAG TPA: TetR/AcrR family transcriptional regulator [Candidatus Ignatzschineria merdigallinarum]|uniref:TetR/AcrR family transcriptional regulator n=1 Tax=Candidatus Ignatzschineria merdigallinarum TaxID=2838621 RepID=A0A9D1TUA1_9GAMM|nr:TetR/AcrR family transcriptional regulator [Candidatus Ignatzschineria merdigallinarum]
MAKTPTKREKMMEETQEKLLKAAREYFGKYGYAATSMDEFTASVGLTRGALYHHFGSKKGLFAEIVTQIDTEIDEVLQEIANKEDDPWRALYKRGIAYLKRSLDPEFQQILLKDAKAILGTELMSIQRRCMDSDIALIEDGMKKGVIRVSSPRIMAVMLDGSLFESAFWIAEAEDSEARLAETLECWRVLLEGIRV